MQPSKNVFKYSQTEVFQRFSHTKLEQWKRTAKRNNVKSVFD